MRYVTIIAALGVAATGVPAHADAQDDIRVALNAYGDCLSNNALVLAKKSKESAEALVRAATGKCKLAYMDAAVAYSKIGIVDIPEHTQKAVMDNAILKVVEKR